MFAQRLRTNGDARRGDGDKETWGGAKPEGETLAGRRRQEDKRGGAVSREWAGPQEKYSGGKRGGATCGAGLRLRGVGKGDVATET